jgi:EpsD family peptidyl-prolyl cis-trans isomerase
MNVPALRCLQRAATAPTAVWVACALVVLSGCGGGDKKDKPASQVAAKVNEEEISVHQINFVLQRQPGVRPEQADEARRQILDRLVDQELAVQKADEMKISRDPNVLMSIEAARREIIARAYADKVAQTAARPTREEVQKYYAEHPELFKERRIYQIQELIAEVPAEKVAAVSDRIKAAKTPGEVAEYLKASNIRFVSNQAFRAAEQLPMSELKTFAGLRDGQSIVKRGPGGLQVVSLLASRSEPVSDDKATAAIEQYLWNERKREVLEKDREHLRAAARIEYVGKYEKAASAPGTAIAPAAAVASGASAAGDTQDAAGEKVLKGSK